MRRRRPLWPAFVGLLLLVVTALPAHADLAGQYRVEGKNPGGDGTYQGRVAVKPHQGVYHVVWQVGQDRWVGTGILRQDQFSVVYANPDRESRPGLVVYEVQGDGSLVGAFVTLGQNQMGTERWRPMP
jgi:hypothetical protein